MTIKANARIDLPLSYYRCKGNICYPVCDGIFHFLFSMHEDGQVFDTAGTTATDGRLRQFSVSGQAAGVH
ncbi:hypothetical protein OS42_10760 [Dickeya oryzae]